MPTKKKALKKALPKKQVKKTAPAKKEVPVKSDPFVTGQRDTTKKSHAKQLVRAFVIAGAILVIPLGLFAYDRFSTTPNLSRNNEQVVIHDIDRTGEIGLGTPKEPIQESIPVDTEVTFTVPQTLKPQKLPFTSSREEYTVQKGDTVYEISLRVCGDQSFYINNMRKNYLRVGTTITVNCAE